MDEARWYFTQESEEERLSYQMFSPCAKVWHILAQGHSGTEGVY